MAEENLPSRVTRRVFLAGAGFVGLAFGRALAAQGWSVTATTRDSVKESAMRAMGWRVIDPVDSAAVLPGHDALLLSAPPPDPFLPLLADAVAPPWVAYLSSTAVYGDHQGGWVDEDTPPRPHERGDARLAAETAWAAWGAAQGVGVHRLRLAGIYGPGRSAFDQLRAGTARAIIKPGHVFCRIHRDDIVGALLATMARPSPPGGWLLNLADDEPTAPEVVLDHAAALLGLPPPPRIPLAEAKLSPMGASFYAASRRVRNTRLQQVLGYRLRYPSYREGLAAILAEAAS